MPDIQSRWSNREARNCLFGGSFPTLGLVGSYSAKVNRDYDSGGFLLLPVAELFVPVLDDADPGGCLLSLNRRERQESLTVSGNVVFGPWHPRDAVRMIAPTHCSRGV